MNRRLEAGWKRITSGFLAFTIVSILILGNSGIAFAEEYDDRFYREETDLSELGEFSKATVSNASFKNSKKDDVVISILSEEGDYRPGGLVFPRISGFLGFRFLWYARAFFRRLWCRL